MDPLESEPFCIFKELFRKYDAEAKLILLEEILLVGEAKELWFLETLATDEDPRVRKRAAVLASQLKERLQDESEQHFAQHAMSGDNQGFEVQAEEGREPMLNFEFDFQQYMDDAGIKPPKSSSKANASKKDEQTSPLMEKLLVKLKQDQP